MIRYTNLPFRHDDEVIVKEEADGFFQLDDDLNRYCSRLDDASSEFIEFRKQLKKSSDEKKIHVSNSKFYDEHMEKAVEISIKYNIKQTSLAKVCRT